MDSLYRFEWVSDRLKRSDQMSIRVENGQFLRITNTICSIQELRLIGVYGSLSLLHNMNMPKSLYTSFSANAVFVWLTCVLFFPAVALSSEESDTRAHEFLNALDGSQREDIGWTFEASERTDIHYAPISLDGVRHDTLDESQTRLAEALLTEVLSKRGYQKVTAIRLLERDIKEMESRVFGLFGLREPGRYFWAFFGDPAKAKPWGFRFEGHHLSLNITAIPGHSLSTTPLFLGAQPREVPKGLPSAGVAVLGEEEQLARTLYGLRDHRQQIAATWPYVDGRGHMIGQVRRLSSPKPIGLARSQMTSRQKALLDELLDLFASLWNAETAAARRHDIAESRDELYFAFVESNEPPNAFYMRVAGPGLLIEIDNTEGGDHVHAVWHDPASDFGYDLLARHWEESHGTSIATFD